MAEVTRRETAYKGKRVQVEKVGVKYGDGPEQEREVVRHRPGAAIVVLRDDSDADGSGLQVVMARQFRPPVEEEVLEIIAGIVDEGETPLEAAQRELREETGLEAETWDELGTLFASPGYTDEELTLFLARDVRHIGGDKAEEEHLEISTLPFALALDQLQRGDIRDLKTAAGLLWAAKFLAEERA